MTDLQGTRYRSRYEGLTDQQLANQLRLAVLRHGSLASSRDWMRACFDSWFAARLRGRSVFVAIAKTHLASIQLFEGWAVEDWRFLCDQVGARSRRELEARDYNALAHVKWLDAKAKRPEDRILPKLWAGIPNAIRVFYRHLPLPQLVAYLKENHPGRTPVEIGKRSRPLLRSIKSRADWREICDAMGWPHESLRGGKKGYFARRYSADPVTAGHELQARAASLGWSDRQVMNSIGNARCPLIDRDIIQLTFPEASIIGARVIKTMTPERAKAISVRIGAGDDELLRARLPRLWAWVRRQGGLGFWERPGLEDVALSSCASLSP